MPKKYFHFFLTRVFFSHYNKLGVDWHHFLISRYLFDEWVKYLPGGSVFVFHTPNPRKIGGNQDNAWKAKYIRWILGATCIFKFSGFCIHSFLFFIFAIQLIPSWLWKINNEKQLLYWIQDHTGYIKLLIIYIIVMVWTFVLEF